MINTTIRDDSSARHSKKYANSNFIHQLVLGRFLDAVAAELEELGKGSVLDFGCGEAFFWQEMKKRNVTVGALTGIDLRVDALAIAQQNHPESRFLEKDLLTWEPDIKPDLVVASQVLEHLPGPEQFLKKLVSITGDKLLLTVPWEPFFMLSNLARGRDILRFGNHPEHINLWGAKGFNRFVSKHAKIVKSVAIFPFLMVVAEPY
ncbi:MAG: class I SAM-dependent methyltransferase [Pseudomonadales bacterium]|nr:class I SAM-dependent methyltransferase [Pseudomonadales bacterium]